MKDRQKRSPISWVDRVEYAVRSRGAKAVVLALVANTMVAQLLYNSAGQLVLGNGFLTGYLFVSAICSTGGAEKHELTTYADRRPTAQCVRVGPVYVEGSRSGSLLVAGLAALLRGLNYVILRVCLRVVPHPL
jgi:hypothetical protein